MNRNESSSSGAFTRYLLAVLQNGEASDKEFEHLWQSLKKALLTQLRYLALLNLPTRYLGLEGAASWVTPDGRDALEELAQECYLSLFVRKLSRFLTMLQESIDRDPDCAPDIDGHLVVCIRNFVRDRRRRNDPSGYRVFEILSGAFRNLISDGEVAIISGPEQVWSSSVLTFLSEGRSGLLASPETLREIALMMCEELMPDLITAQGAGRTRVKQELRQELLKLPRRGATTFRFNDLVTPLKEEIRGRLRALRESWQVDSVPDPRSRFESEESFARLAECVGRALESGGDRPKTFRYLERLWIYLRDFATDAMRDVPPPRVRLSELLKIPRNRFPGLYERLGELVHRCKEQLSGPVVEEPGSQPEGEGHG